VLLDADPVIRDMYLSTFELSVLQNYYVMKVPDVKIYQDLLMDIKLRLNEISETQKIPQLIASADVTNCLNNLFAVVCNGRYRRMYIPINRETFDVYDVLLVQGILIAFVFFPANAFRKEDRILMRNYLYYHHLTRIHSRYLKFDFEDRAEFRNGMEDAIASTKFIVSEPGGVRYATLLMEFLGPDDKTCFSEGGVEKNVAIPDENKDMYPGERIWYPLIWMTGNGEPISEYTTSSRLDQLKGVLVSASQNGGTLYKEKNDRDSSLTSIMIATVKNLTRFAKLMWKLSLILPMMCGSPICSPCGYNDESYDNLELKTEPFRLLGASLSALPFSLDYSDVLIRTSNNAPMYKWALNEFVSIQELAERLTYYSKVLPKPLFNMTDRIEAAFKSRRFPSVFDQHIKKAWMMEKNYVLDFNVSEDLENSEYYLYRQLTEKFIQNYKPLSFGYVEKFHYLAYLPKVLKDLNYDAIYAINVRDFATYKKYDGDEDIIKDIIDDNLKNVIDGSVSSYTPKLVTYKIPTKVTLEEFEDVQKFNTDQHPLAYDHNGIKYGSLTVYERQINTEHKNVDTLNAFFYTGPPRFLIEYDEIPRIDFSIDGLIDHFSTIDVYTEQMHFVKDFTVFRSSLYKQLYSD